MDKLYFGLRDYGHDGQIGLEDSPEAYVAKLVDVFREVKRLLRDDGTLWVVIGDSYATGTTASRQTGNRGIGKATQSAQDAVPRIGNPFGCKTKDLIGIPWMAAFALRADGWYLRADIIWHKPNPMPESVTDRPTKAHEYIFLLSKSRLCSFADTSISRSSSVAASSAITDSYSSSFSTALLKAIVNWRRWLVMAELAATLDDLEIEQEDIQRQLAAVDTKADRLLRLQEVRNDGLRYLEETNMQIANSWMRRHFRIHVADNRVVRVEYL